MRSRGRAQEVWPYHQRENSLPKRQICKANREQPADEPNGTDRNGGPGLATELRVVFRHEKSSLYVTWSLRDPRFQNIVLSFLAIPALSVAAGPMRSPSPGIGSA
jgi:hypothetical protein